MSHRGDWELAAAGCTALAGLLARASAALLAEASSRGSDDSELCEVLEAALEMRAAERACRCIEDTQAAVAGSPDQQQRQQLAAEATRLLWSMVFCPSSSTRAPAAGAYFPFPEPEEGGGATWHAPASVVIIKVVS